MRINYSISFNGGEPYQMHHMNFSIDDSDLSEKYRDLGLSDKLCVGQMYLFLQGVMFRVSGGDISKENGDLVTEAFLSGPVGKEFRRILSGLKRDNPKD